MLYCITHNQTYWLKYQTTTEKTVCPELYLQTRLVVALYIGCHDARKEVLLAKRKEDACEDPEIYIN